MASDGITVRLEGVDELKRALADAAVKIRTKAVRNALSAAARVISKQAKLNAPILKSPKESRKPGTVRNAISVRRSKVAREDGNEGVFVSVRPLRAKARRTFKVARAAAGKSINGSENPDDPYYWWWVEFGHRIVPRTSKRSLVGAAFGFTTYQQRLRNGKIVTRTRKYNHQSITGRRRNAAASVPGQFFMTRAAESRGTEAIQTFMNRVVPQIEKLNAKASRVR